MVHDLQKTQLFLLGQGRLIALEEVGLVVQATAPIKAGAEIICSAVGSRFEAGDAEDAEEKLDEDEEEKDKEENQKRETAAEIAVALEAAIMTGKGGVSKEGEDQQGELQGDSELTPQPEVPAELKGAKKPKATPKTKSKQSAVSASSAFVATEEDRNDDETNESPAKNSAKAPTKQLPNKSAKPSAKVTAKPKPKPKGKEKNQADPPRSVDDETDSATRTPPSKRLRLTSPVSKEKHPPLDPCKSKPSEESLFQEVDFTKSFSKPRSLFSDGAEVEEIQMDEELQRPTHVYKVCLSLFRMASDIKYVIFIGIAVGIAHACT